jgi:hypothetical protein
MRTPRSGPIGLLPPELVAMTAPQREAAIQRSLAVLLRSWMCERNYGRKSRWLRSLGGEV